MRQLVFTGPRACEWIDSADPARFDEAVDAFAEPFTKLIFQREPKP